MRAHSYFSLRGGLVFTLCCVSWIAAGCGGGTGEVPPASITAEGASGGAAAPAPANPDDLAATGSYAAPRPEPNPRVVIHTSHGDITVLLDRKNAPITVENFMSYVDAKFYDDTIFHYVGKGHMLLAGAYDAAGREKPTRQPILNEAHNGLSNLKGTIAMSRNPAEQISATSQFYFNLADNADLNHKDADSPQGYGYCVFGEVVSGLDVLEKIAAVAVEDRPNQPKTPLQPVVIRAIQRVD